MRNRAVSRVVPEPNTRPGRDPGLGGEPGGEVGHHVHRVRGDDDHRIRGVLQHRRDDLAEHRGVAPQELEPGFPGLLPDAGAQHDRLATREVGVAAGPDLERVGERDGVADVVRLRGRAGLVLVDQHDLAADAPHHQGVRRGRTDQPAPDDADFHGPALQFNDETALASMDESFGFEHWRSQARVWAMRNRAPHDRVEAHLASRIAWWGEV